MNDLDQGATYLLENALKVQEVSLGIYSNFDLNQFMDAFAPWDHSDGYRLKISELVGKKYVKTHEWEETKKPGIDFHVNKFKTYNCATFTFITVKKPGCPYLVIDGNKRLIAILSVLEKTSIKYIDVKALLIESIFMERMEKDDYQKVLDRL